MKMKLITIKDVSEFLKVKKSTVYSWVSSGTIPFYKLNGLLRFDIEEIEDWVIKAKSQPVKAQKTTLKSRRYIDLDSIINRTIDEIKGHKV